MRPLLDPARLAPALFGALLLGAQSSPAFDLEAYRQHLARTRELTAAQILAAHRPFGPYWESVPAGADPEYLAPLSSHFGLTAGELQLLRQHGFVVSERLRFESYGQALRDIWVADLPVFVSSDAILHALHRSYVNLLATVEERYLSIELRAALEALHAGWPALETRYAGSPGMRASLDDVDVYLTVAQSLLAGAQLGSAGDNAAVVGEILDLVAAEQPADMRLFNDSYRHYDFSQMKPRGHYTRTEDLKRYFRAMMWLGRTELRLTEPPGLPPTPDVTREIVDAYLLRELMPGDALERLQHIDQTIRALVGAPDNVTLGQLDRLATAAGIQRADQLLDRTVMARFRAELGTGRYTEQAINSQILLSDPMHTEDLDPPYAFLLMGQRFILDSYVTGNVVYDRIEYQGGHPFRGLPSPLDVLYTLGNDDALPLLQSEIETWHYAPNLRALRYLIDGYEPEYWSQSLYTVWLQAIRTLSKSGRQAGVPDFMRTVAWQQEKMNSQLASWTELRHDNLLYAKQSYTGGSICSFPRTYIEPVPELYRVLQRFAAEARTVFGSLPWPEPWMQLRVRYFFENMAQTMDRLATIASKEVSGDGFTPEETQFLSEVLRVGGICGASEQGWYPALFFSDADRPASEPDLLIADVHTQPTDAGGNWVGYVLHAATGSPEMGIFVAAPPGQPLTAFAGPVASYVEHVTANFTRRTDEEWQALYAQGPPARPDWTHVYLADAQGNVRTTGRRLAADDSLPPEQPIPAPPAAVRLQIAPNVPNPFNPTTHIAFRVDAPAPLEVSLAVYDARGRLVRELLHDVLPANAYHATWDGRDRSDRAVVSGIYYAVVRAGGSVASRKMALLN